tara:strand:- start:2313 stop:3314 length:1002 start_codon:yes stop_codon:yes gene_type:complete
MQKHSNGKHNAAIYLLSSRVKLLEECLLHLYKNWNFQYDYPIYVHHFDNIYSEEFKNRVKNNISSKIYFHQIDYEVPSFINETELFYNRKYLKYVRKSFSKKRLGYLHMEHFVTNITSYGKTGCLVNELRQFDKLMRIDDESYFKSKIEFDLFDVLDNYPFATGYTWSKYSYRELDTRENLWKFYKQYISDKKIIPKSKILEKAIKENDEKLMHDLKWSAGNLNLYNMNIFKNNEQWDNYLREINNSGGTYKHRWGDIECIGLFGYTFFKTPIFDLKLKDKNLYNNKFPSIFSDIAPSVGASFNLHNFLPLKWFSQIKNFIKKFIGKSTLKDD